MKFIIKVAAVLALITIIGCSQDEQNDKPVKAADIDLLKTQRDALEQAKQVEQVLNDAAAQQRQDIDQSTQ
ncbi:MAG: hypothetical protein ACNA7G_13455 [Methylobacter sp.]